MVTTVSSEPPNRMPEVGAPASVLHTHPHHCEADDAGTFVLASRHARQAWTAALSLLTLYAAFGLTRFGASLDQSMRATLDDTSTGLLWLAHLLVGVITPFTVTMSTVVVAMVAWRYAGRRPAVETVLSISVALGLAESLKALLPTVSHRPGEHLVIGGSFPSGHVAVTTALVLAVLSVSTPRFARVLRVPAVVLPAATAVSTIAVGWHRPSDAVGGVLVAVAAHHGVRALTRRRTRVPSSC